jgi:hypothetical protein
MYQAMVFTMMVMMATHTDAHSRVFGDILLNKFMACIVK